jgi:lysophospholipase
MNDMNNGTIGYVSPNQGISIRWGVWTTARHPPRGTVLLLSGRGEYLEKYQETAADLINRGFDVYSFDWRGQGLSTRMLANRQKGFVETYEDYLDDLDCFIQTIMMPGARAPYYLLAHSMGGHIGLRYLHDHPDMFKGAVLTAPLIDIAMPPAFKKVLRAYIRGATILGFGKQYVPGAGDHKQQRQRFQNNKLTSDRMRFERMNRQLTEMPDLALGGVTHQWLLATLRSVDRLREQGFAEKIETPVLIVAAGKDEIVSSKAQAVIQKRLPRCRLVNVENARHELLVETDEVRRLFWKVFDEFILN